MPTQEPSSEVSAVLRREAEQLLEEFRAIDERYPNGARVYDKHVAEVEAFARRQRAQALESAADFLDGEADGDAGTLASALELRRRAAAEGTET